MANALACLVHDEIKAGRISPSLDPLPTGAAMLGMIERLFAYEDVFGRRGSSQADLTSTLAVILYQTLVDGS